MLVSVHLRHVVHVVPCGMPVYIRGLVIIQVMGVIHVDFCVMSAYVCLS